MYESVALSLVNVLCGYNLIQIVRGRFYRLILLLQSWNSIKLQSNKINYKTGYCDQIGSVLTIVSYIHDGQA